MNKAWLNKCRLAVILGLLGGNVRLGAQSTHLLAPLSTPSASAGGDSYSPLISADGRLILFSSTADNLVLQTNKTYPGRQNVYLSDQISGTMVLISVSADGTTGGSGDSFGLGLSTNGQYVLFESSATNLVAGDTNNVSDVFVRDLVNNTTTLVSVAADGSWANGPSRSSTMTPDGRYVAFVSAATNLVAGDTNRIPDIFERDLQAGTTVLVSTGAKSASITSSSEAPEMTPDGRVVVFTSTATNLIAGLNTTGELYYRDTVLNSTVQISGSVAHSKVLSYFHSSSLICYNQAVSDDGRYITFQAAASTAATSGVVLRFDLVFGGVNVLCTNALGPKTGFEAGYRSMDVSPDGRFIAYVNKLSSTSNAVYIYDSINLLTELVSVNLSGTVSGNADCYWPQISDDGNIVSFFTSATNMAPGQLAGNYNHYIRDRQAGTTTLAEVRSYKTDFVSLSADGRYLAFQSADVNLIANDGNRDADVFVRDLSTGQVALVSASQPSRPLLSPNGSSGFAAFSGSLDERYIAFCSEADNLTANDTNRYRNVFVHDQFSGANVLASVSSNGVTPANALSYDPVISADGHFIAFTSLASNLGPVTDANGASDVFVRDWMNGTNFLVSINTNGTAPGNAASYSPAISANGRYVLFHSKAGNLVRGASSVGVENIYVRDLLSGATQVLGTNSINTNLMAVITPDGHYAACGGSGVTLAVWDLPAMKTIYTTAVSVTGLALSSDGAHLAYYSTSQTIAVDLAAKTVTSLGLQPVNSRPGLQFSADGRFLACNPGGGATLFDFQTKAIRGISSGTGLADSAALSPDGRYVAYRSTANDIASGDNNGQPDIFVYDQSAQTTTLVSRSIYGNATGNSFSFNPVFSGDSQNLFFQSWASDLVPQDFNQSGDLFSFSLNNPGFSVLLTGRGGLTWPIAAGKNYQVQYKDNLTDANWQMLNGVIVTNSYQGSLNDPAPPLNRRFYRVVAY